MKIDNPYSFLDSFTPENNVTYYWQIGPLQLWLKKSNDEILIAENRASEKSSNYKENDKHEKPDDIDWRRWVVNPVSNNIFFKATMADLPVVVRPENELKILPNEKALFYVLLPVWLRICTETKNEKERVIYELPSSVLSQTWFGTSEQGELAYSLKTSARRSIDNIKLGIHQAVCPVNIYNNSSADLDFKRLCLEVKHLSLYYDKNHLWTNLINVTFRGEDHISQIKFSEKAPDNLKTTMLIGNPRNKISKSFAKKSFDTFKSFTGF